MLSFPIAMEKLIRELAKLPSIGEKSAIRLAYHLVNDNRDLAGTLSHAIIDAAQSVQLCECCFFLSDNHLCSVCKNSSRDESLICVVEKPMDLAAIERVGEYRGLYHVLHGVWAPLKGQGPESMKLTELLERVDNGVVQEVILATGSTVEGDATALYIAKLLEERGIQTTRLAQGMPKGGELEYADEVTLSRAFSGRNTLSS
ncbi:recombination mediator RecR [Oligoflexia bacterium]|nr:recombination mediator RecR [Oligoflexia bacterium]